MLSALTVLLSFSTINFFTYTGNNIQSEIQQALRAETNLAVVMEADLADGHVARLHEIAPRRVHHLHAGQLAA